MTLSKSETSAPGWAVITGASAGLGADFARQLAARGHDVVVTARRRDRLEQLANSVRAKHAVQALVVQCDLGAADGPAHLLEALQSKEIVPTVFVNNAGFGVHGLAIEQPVQRHLEMLDLNVRAFTELALTIAAQMVERGSGSIINIGSTGSFQPSPYVAAYAATKAYVLSFSEALAWELEPKGVHVLAHCPGPTRTEFFDAAKMHLGVGDSLFMSSEQCVALALRALHNRQRVCVPGFMNALGAWLARVSPQRWSTAIAAKVMRPAPPPALPTAKG